MSSYMLSRQECLRTWKCRKAQAISECFSHLSWVFVKFPSAYIFQQCIKTRIFSFIKCPRNLLKLSYPKSIDERKMDWSRYFMSFLHYVLSDMSNVLLIHHTLVMNPACVVAWCGMHALQWCKAHNSWTFIGVEKCYGTYVGF